METKQVDAHILHEDGYCSLICQIVWQPDLKPEARKDFLHTLEAEFDRIMKRKE